MTDLFPGQNVRLIADPSVDLNVVELLDDGQVRLSNDRYYLPDELKPGRNNEQWADIEGTDGTHQVSNYGRVMALYFRGKPRPRLLKPLPTKGGGLLVNMSVPSGMLTSTLAQLVAHAFLPPPPRPDYRVRPLDGNPANVHHGNLAWYDPRETKDPTVLAYLKRGRSYGTKSAKFSPEQESQLIARLRKGEPQHLLAKEFGVTRPTITQLATRHQLSRRLGKADKRKALARLAAGESVTSLADELGIARLTLYRWQQAAKEEARPE